MLKKLLALMFTLAFTFTMFGTATYAADTNGNNNEDAAVATTNDDDDMEWGWIGLIGLAGLMGLKRRDDRKN
jgi:hypothetical protein